MELTYTASDEDYLFGSPSCESGYVIYVEGARRTQQYLGKGQGRLEHCRRPQLLRNVGLLCSEVGRRGYAASHRIRRGRDRVMFSIPPACLPDDLGRVHSDRRTCLGLPTCTGTRSLHQAALPLCPVFPTMSDTSYPNETRVAGSYEPGESRTQIVFAGRDGSWGDTSTMQSMSG